jgi:drug/metabolite transporter (DMT)-like permease
MLEQFYSLIRRSDHSHAVLLMVIGSFMIALGPFLVEFSSVSAETSTFYRLLIGALFFFFYSVWNRDFSFDLRFFIFGSLAGVLLVSDLFLWNQSVLYIGAGLSTILANLEIVFLVFIAKLFFDEKLPQKFLLLSGCIALGVCSLLLPILSDFSSKNGWGIFLALGASLSYSLYIFSIKYIGKKFPQQTATNILFIACLSGCLLLGIVICSRDLHMFSLQSWESASLVFLNTVLTQVIGWWCISKGIIHLKLSLSGLLLLLQPALTFFLDSLILKRNTHYLQLFGCLLLLFALYIVTQNQKLPEKMK